MRPLLRSDVVGITQLHGAQVTSGAARRKNGVYFKTLADAIATAMCRIDTVTTREARRCWCLCTSRPRLLYDDHSHTTGQVRRIFRPHFASALTPMVPSHKGPLVEHWTPTMIYVPTHGRHHAVSCQLVIAEAPSCAHRRPVGGFGDEAMQRLTRRLHQPCSIRIALDSAFLSSAAEQQRGTMRRGRS
jgi:hypothetical protein